MGSSGGVCALRLIIMRRGRALAGLSSRAVVGGSRSASGRSMAAPWQGIVETGERGRSGGGSGSVSGDDSRTAGGGCAVVSDRIERAGECVIERLGEYLGVIVVGGSCSITGGSTSAVGCEGLMTA